MSAARNSDFEIPGSGSGQMTASRFGRGTGTILAEIPTAGLGRARLEVD